MRWAGLAAMLVLASCGSGAKAATATSSTSAARVEASSTTTIALSDAATAWCGISAHLAAIEQTSATLRVAPQWSVDEKDHMNADGTRDIAGLESAFNTDNDDPAHHPHYGTQGTVGVVVNSPFYWWDQADWTRICNAAFASR